MVVVEVLLGLNLLVSVLLAGAMWRSRRAETPRWSGVGRGGAGRGGRRRTAVASSQAPGEALGVVLPLRRGPDSRGESRSAAGRFDHPAFAEDRPSR